MTQRDYLRVTELMYHPPPVTAAEAAAGFSSNEDFEFVELMNTGPTNVSLLGVRLTAGVTFDFSTSAVTNLAPGQRVLAVARKAAFVFRYGSNPLVAGAYAGHFDNAGELVRLVDAFDNVIQEFTYDDGGNWPPAADGAGRSLEVLDVNGDYNNPANWQASAFDGGTPGLPPLIRPMFLSATRDGPRLRLRFLAAPDQSYLVSWCSSLADAQWNVLEAIPAGGSARIEEVEDALSPVSPPRFYRLTSY